MTQSLLPETPIVFSPSLAASIGLEQAILMQTLDRACNMIAATGNVRSRDGYCWSEINLDTLRSQLPFWNHASIRRILQDLIDLGMVFIEPFPNQAEQTFAFAFNQKQSETPSTKAATANLPQYDQHQRQDSHWLDTQHSLGAHKIPHNWQPDSALCKQLAAQGVEQDFVAQQVAEFVLYWQERDEVAHSWSSKFLHHVTRSWQHEQQTRERERQQSPFARSQSRSDSLINKQWQPSEDALEILARMGIHRNFIDDAIPEFVLYWQERGETQSTWNSKFVSHVKRQWARYTHTLKHDTEPKPLADNWQPDADVFDLIAIANIDESFARGLIPEFVMYWRDKNELHHSWNTRFLQFVKHQWARNYRQHDSSSENNANGTHRPGDANRKTRDRSLIEDLTDRSWAS